ncbi:MAG: hypothetical protein DRJ51_05895 [Thermoprotei archaeon]|nr:MAG: hypothetical protein DRP77_07085 [Candidatus Poribacteria bacterium]RLE80402.1 MAG: hypothetical protein DRJ51_05895 [Thermoprotei archaeon]
MDLKEKDNSKGGPVERFHAEVNSITFPFFLLEGQEEVRVITYKGVMREGERTIEFTWTVSADPSYGLPRAFDWQVFRAIEFLISDMPKPVENPITFSFYDLCRKMRINTSGANYESIKNSIRRIKSTTIRSERAYYLKEKGRRITTEVGFSFYDMYVFINERLPDGTVADTNYLWLNPYYLSNINHSYVKPLDPDYYWSLRRLVSRRLYEILSVKFYGVPDPEIPLKQSYAGLCEVIRLTPQKYLSWARRTLDPAHDELVKTGFLKSVEWRKDGRKPGSWFILYTPGPRAISEIERARKGKVSPPLPQLSQDQREVIEELELRGVAPKIARRLAIEHDPEKIREVIEYIDWYRKQPNKVQNWGAYIAELIRDPDFSVPPEFKKAVERERERKRREKLERRAREILEERIEEALRNWSDDRIIQEKLEKALRARDVLVKGGMARPYTPEEIENLKREIERSLPKSEEEKRRWLIFNGGERFNLESIMREIEKGEDLGLDD